MRVCVGEDIEPPLWKDLPVDPVPTNFDRFADAVDRVHAAGKAMVVLKVGRSATGARATALLRSVCRRR